MNDNKQLSPLFGKRERLAEMIFADFVSRGMMLQKTPEKLAEEARTAAAGFYPDEQPPPSIPMTKAV